MRSVTIEKLIKSISTDLLIHFVDDKVRIADVKGSPILHEIWGAANIYKAGSASLTYDFMDRERFWDDYDPKADEKGLILYVEQDILEEYLMFK